MSRAAPPVALYTEQSAKWPSSGRHVLARYDEDAVVVYQAFRPAIAIEAVAQQRFGTSFSRSRMSWIKPNFLWMMFRCGWATKVDQERVLALSIRRTFFEGLLAHAVWSSFSPERHSTEAEWRDALASSDVRLQWDPDHEPDGTPLERRAVQLGLRGRTLAEYADSAILQVIDATPFVESQRDHARRPYRELVVPIETVFLPRDPRAAQNSGLEWDKVH